MSVVIQVERLAKQYRLGQIGSGRLADDVNYWLARLRGKQDPVSPIGSTATSRRASGSNRFARNSGPTDSWWALKNVSFEVNQGEVLGLIGRNGAGKSTLLKILSRVTAPTVGEVRIKGRIASLLEVGTGFHPELTGRENIFLNGAILGMTKREIHGKFDEIVAFSEAEEFIDTPVKRFSSGMYVRLAFAVAAHLEPEILIVDEVLAVGDAAFQKKCIGKMQDVAGQGRTVLFVSHNMEAIRSLCHRAVWLKQGSLQGSGAPDEIIDAYFDSIPNEISFAGSHQAHGLAIRKVVLKNDRGQECSQFCPGEDLIVEISYDAQSRLDNPYVTVGVVGSNGPCFTANMLLDGARPEVLDGVGTLACRFKHIPLLPQNFIVKMGIRGKNEDEIHAYKEVASFRVVGDLADYGYKGNYLERASRYTPVVVPYEWHLPGGAVTPVSLRRLPA